MNEVEVSQNEIIEEFMIFDNWIDKYQYIIELGRELTPLTKDEKIEYAEPLEVDKENTLFLYRDLPNDRKHWADMLRALEVHGYFLLNPCNFHVKIHKLFRENKIQEIVLYNNHI